jgi:GTPase involved in cell partitioning and DNA repair
VVQLPDLRSFRGGRYPGIIEGAHEGRGLGIQFLKHVERTKLLVHLVDMSETGRDPVHDFETLMTELASFSEDLARSRCWWRQQSVRLPKRGASRSMKYPAQPAKASKR